MKKTFKSLLEELKACEEAIVWAENMPIEEVILKCDRGDWLLWLAKKVDVDLKPLTLAKARCAKTVIHLMKYSRSIDAVNIAENFGLGKATIEELNKAASSAALAAANAANGVDAALAAAYAAAYAAVDVANTVDAALAAAYAAAYAAVDVANAVDADANTARVANQLQTADICREILGELIIDKVNIILKHYLNL